MNNRRPVGRPRFRAPRTSAAAASQLAGYLRDVARRPPYAPEVQRALTTRLTRATHEFRRAVYAMPWSQHRAVAMWREVCEAGRTSNRLSDSFGVHASEDRDRIERCMRRLASSPPHDPEEGAALLLDAHLSHEILRQLHRGLLTLETDSRDALARGAGNAAPFAEEAGLPLPDFWARMVEVGAAYREMTLLKNELVERNLGLVLRQASQFEHLGLPAADLVQEGNAGLLRAAERFDPDRGVGFAAYALWWIRHAIVRGVQNHSRTVRLPSNQHDALREFRRSVVALERQLGREPSREELAASLGLSGQRVDELRQLQATAVSLDARQGEGDDGAEVGLHDLLPDPRSSRGMDAIEHASMARNVLAEVAQLSLREQRILFARYGLDGRPPRSFREIGSELSLSGERARQLEARAIERLRQAMIPPPDSDGR